MSSNLTINGTDFQAETDDFPFDPFDSLVLFSVLTGFASILFFSCMVCCFEWKERYDQRHHAKAVCIFWWAPVFALIGCACLLAYSAKMHKLNKQDYYGPMRVTDVSFETNWRRQSDDAPYKYKASLDAVLQVQWDASSCGNMDKTECESELVYCSRTICLRDYKYCNADEYDRAFERVKDCRAHGTFMGYGDCESCDVSKSVPSFSSAQNCKITGFVFLGMSVVVGLCLLGLPRKRRYPRPMQAPTLPKPKDSAAATTLNLEKEANENNDLPSWYDNLTQDHISNTFPGDDQNSNTSPGDDKV